ncbi:hypothetical acetyltransferase GNAT family protein [Photobacterium profundum 3TCK]|uniref:Hypothetical acetyltransferase GNAT family protein n=2 Tax=Photobacterium profundum TaxID=74109 RepID=Q1YYH5_9GAMM|nr:hypothetical acetyltransferase GNAT family protein [Photobacterium profundum 3TCK]
MLGKFVVAHLMLDVSCLKSSSTMIRIAENKDYASLVSLFIEENEHNNDVAPDRVANTRDVLSQAELEEIISDTSTYLGVYEHDGEVSGLILGTHHTIEAKRWLPERNFVYLEELIVTKSMRGNGVAFKLVKSLETWAETFGANCIDLHVWYKNDLARDFYKRLGFEDKQALMSIRINS